MGFTVTHAAIAGFRREKACVQPMGSLFSILASFLLDIQHACIGQTIRNIRPGTPTRKGG